jgi:hypothetical protein
MALNHLKPFKFTFTCNFYGMELDFKFGGGDIRHADKQVSDTSAVPSAAAETDEDKRERLYLYACGGQAVHMISPKKFSCRKYNCSEKCSALICCQNITLLLYSAHQCKQHYF